MICFRERGPMIYHGRGIYHVMYQFHLALSVRTHCCSSLLGVTAPPLRVCNAALVARSLPLLFGLHQSINQPQTHPFPRLRNLSFVMVPSLYFCLPKSKPSGMSGNMFSVPPKPLPPRMTYVLFYCLFAEIGGGSCCSLVWTRYMFFIDVIKFGEFPKKHIYTSHQPSR